MLVQQLLRQAGGFFAEHQIRTIGIVDVGIDVGALGGEIEKRAGVFFEKLG